MQPSVGRIVHYNERGECRAAIITDTDGKRASLTVFTLFGTDPHPLPLAEGTEPGTWHWPEHT
ncbi:hypothetical protein [Streptomyces sp. NPDC020983]|uniref:hypothetical protein n=1 Tax=Streptomyces sp. NPDC020983 TaxID=3365106 RepID=UPI0037A1ECF9